eukprot:TRINITY_DN544_c0_g1_i4.p2 TRINITY_DN544_c0_g1~~TRINITY_DN544_c0_g1_i4.p2  ORF type:complete len:341 (+),score=139.06 TRINITY_DN544_c0_g1_i4:944-1966(+)
MCCATRGVGCVPDEVRAEKEACTAAARGGDRASAPRSCCREFGMLCRGERFDCFDGAEKAWGAAQTRWCCRRRNVCPAHVCDAAALVGSADARAQCCEVMGRCGGAPVVPEKEVAVFGRGKVTEAVALKFAGDSAALLENPMYMLGRVRKAVLAAAPGLSPDDVLVTTIGVLRDGARPGAEFMGRWAVNFTAGMNAELAADEVVVAGRGAARGAAALEVAFAGAKEGLWFDASVAVASRDAAAALEAELTAATPEEAAHDDYMPLTGFAPTAAPAAGSDSGASWAAPVAAVASLLCVGTVAAALVVLRKRDAASADAAVSVPDAETVASAASYEQVRGHL